MCARACVCREGMMQTECVCVRDKEGWEAVCVCMCIGKG